VGVVAGPHATATLGWLDGAYVDFRCARRSPGGAALLEGVIHRFASPAFARAAVPSWQAGHTPRRNEAYTCASVGSLVVCADGSAPDGTWTYLVVKP
jgi:hypothetical protein